MFEGDERLPGSFENKGRAVAHRSESRFTWTWLLGLLALGTACGSNPASNALNQYPPATIQTAADMKVWASASAPQVFEQATLPLELAAFASSSDAGCPVVSEQGSTKTIQGGCTSPSGEQWVGTVTMVTGPADSGTITYDGFGWTKAAVCDGGSVQTSFVANGTFDVTASNGASNFVAHVVLAVSGMDAGCAAESGTLAWDYSGSQAGKTWNGSGRVGSSVMGVVTAQTQSELVDSSVCQSTAASGTTTVQAGSNTAVLTYIGATSCTNPPTATWTLNGSAMGSVSGVSCAAAPGARVGPWALMGLLVVAAAFRSRARN